MERTEKPKTTPTFLGKLKRPGKNAFWIWVGYQCVKGTLTLSFIWIPLFYVWFYN